jgi:enamine deaminase RidA (YjgF/YER057c/UK114 family)
VETYRTVRNEFFTDPMPPNTLVICESLAVPEFLMEVEAIAVLG